MSDYHLYGGKPPHQKSDTSEGAAEAIEPEVGRLQRMVLDHLREHGTATDDELEVALGLKHQTVSARRRELVLDGLVADTGERRATRSGVRATVWALAGEIPVESGADPEVDPRLSRPTFRKLDVPEPPPEEVKRYKAYLTRLSKWLAYEEADNKGYIAVLVLRRALVSRGERGVYIDDRWVKKVFGDKGLFEDADQGFWKCIARPEDAPSQPTPWEGPRPGEDVIGDALVRAWEEVNRVARTEVLNPRSPFMDTDDWIPVHRTMVGCLEAVKSRGFDKPLDTVQERAFAESLLDADPTVQLIACWLLNTRALVDVMRRLLAHVRGQEPSLLPYEVDFWAPPTGQPRSPEATLAHVRGLLLNRGILGGKKA